MAQNESVATPPATASAEEIAAYGVPAIALGLSHAAAHGERVALMSVTGMRCASCSWLAKSALEGLAGVSSASVDVAPQRAEITYDPMLVCLEDLINAITDVGFGARVYQREATEAALAEERQAGIRDLGLSILFGMQVMLASLALYLGEPNDMPEAFRVLFRYFAMVMASLIIILPARRFFTGAYNALRHRRVTMDVPIAVGLALAYCGSALSTLSGEGEVYFDSVAMFTALLSCGPHDTNRWAGLLRSWGR